MILYGVMLQVPLIFILYSPKSDIALKIIIEFVIDHY